MKKKFMLKKLKKEDEYEVPEKKGDEEMPPPKLKKLPKELRYEYLDESKKIPVIISSKLLAKKEESLMTVLRTHRGAFGYLGR